MKSKIQKRSTPNTTKWKNENYVRIYELVRMGTKFKHVAEQLGVSVQTLKEWKKKDPAVRFAFQRGREFAQKDGGPGSTFLEYVYNRLPEDLQDTWKQLDALSTIDSGEKRVEAVLAGHGKRERQTLFVHALIACNFNAAEACRRVNIPYITLTKWKETDPDFIGLMDTIHEMKKDFVEGALMGLVAQGDTSAVLFCNRTLNKDRGYDPKITVEHRGRVDHGLDLMQLGLPLKVVEMVLEAMQKKSEAPKQLEAAPRVLPVTAKVVDDNEELLMEDE